MAKFYWLSLGENCLSDRILQRHGLKSFNTPFSSGRTNIDYALACETAGYEGLLDPSQLRYQDVFGKPVVRSIRYANADPIFAPEVSNGFEFSHHDLIVDEASRESFQRKVDRLQQIKRDGENTVFLYHHRHQNTPSIPRVIEKLNAFRSHYTTMPGQRCFVLLLTQTIDPNVEISACDVHQVSTDLLHCSICTKHIWAGDGDFWAEKDDHLIAHALSIARGLTLKPEFVEHIG
jgi:hypothetical protein